MAIQSQIYKAPSLPKMGKNSSPLSSSSQKIDSVVKGPKLKTSKMSFIKGLGISIITAESLKTVEKPVISTNTLKIVDKIVLKPEKSKGIDKPEIKDKNLISSELAETNSILVEIQKQLALDFAARIEERKDKLAIEKKKIRTKKLGEKEKFVEKGKGLLKPIAEFGKKALQPIKGIFDKILDFLTLVGVGFVVNNLWEFLKDEKNREKIVEIFAFLKTYWKEILVTLVGIKLIESIVGFIGFGTLLYAIGAKLVAVAARILGKEPKPPAPKPPAPKPPAPAPKPKPPKPIRPIKPVLPGSDGSIINPTTGKPFQSQLPGTPSGRGPSIPKPGQGITPKVNPNPGINPGIMKNLLNPANLKSLAFGLAGMGIGVVTELSGQFAINYASDRIKESQDKGFAEYWANASQEKKEEKSGRLIAEIKKELDFQQSPLHLTDKILKGGGRTLSEFKVTKNLQRLKVLGYSNLADGIDLPDYAKEVRGYSKGGSVFKRVKGTVSGTGSGNKDTVKALLAPGEEVIRTSSSNLFRPLLKDINDNAGRMWNSFTTAIRKQNENNILQEEVNEKFEGTIKLFNDEIIKILNERKKDKLKELEKRTREAEQNNSSGNGNGGERKSRPIPLKVINFDSNNPPGEPQITSVPLVVPHVVPVPKPSPDIGGYRGASRNGGGTSQVSVINNTQPGITLANQSPEPIETESTERSQTSINISSTDSSNPYIMNSYVNYGIDV